MFTMVLQVLFYYKIIFRVYLDYVYFISGYIYSKVVSIFKELYLLEMYINYICKAIFIILKLCYLCYEFIFIIELYFKMI